MTTESDRGKTWRALKTVLDEMGFAYVSIYAPGKEQDEDVPVLGLMMAVDEPTLIQMIKAYREDSASDV